jgi:hypothetical protein
MSVLLIWEHIGTVLTIVWKQLKRLIVSISDKRIVVFSIIVKTWEYIQRQISTSSFLICKIILMRIV